MTDTLSRREALKYAGALGFLAGSAGLPRLAAAQEVLNIGVVYVSPLMDVGWIKQHSLGVQAIETAFPGKVKMNIVENVFDAQAAERVFQSLATSGNQLIFGTSFSHGTPMQKVAPRFPKVTFEHCSGIKHLPNLGTFEAKYYEGTYVAGVAAGSVSKTRKIGFIGGFPVPDIVGPANALLLGARSVDPEVTCTVIFLNSWFDPGLERDAATTLINQGCDVVCSMTDTPVGVQTAEERGTWSIGYASDMKQYGPTKQLTAYTLDWRDIYVQAASDVLNGTWKSNSRWLGLKDGVVKMAPYSTAIPPEGLARIAQVEADIKAGKIHPYAGELRDQSGQIRVPGGSVLSDADIRSMNWFVEGVIGKA